MGSWGAFLTEVGFVLRNAVAHKSEGQGKVEGESGKKKGGRRKEKGGKRKGGKGKAEDGRKTTGEGGTREVNCKAELSRLARDAGVGEVQCGSRCLTSTLDLGNMRWLGRS